MLSILKTTSAFIFILWGGLGSSPESIWGFYPHKMINRMAVFTLPPEMMSFYKHHIYTITSLAIQADRRRYAFKAEAPRHYIDLDYYGPLVPERWFDAQEKYPLDSLEQHGILPWHLTKVKRQLTKAFIEKDYPAIIRISADAGHYLADAHVPLHTTKNYNGQFTNQLGIHGFWETRIPELLWEHFDLWVGKASYWETFDCDIWDIAWASFEDIGVLLKSEAELSAIYPKDKKFSYEVRKSQTIRVYSQQFTRQYHKLIESQVERRLRLSIKAVGNFWFTCWVDAGQPVLNIKSKSLKFEIDDVQNGFDGEYHQPRDTVQIK